MDRLIFHEDETGIATLHDLSAFQYFEGYSNSGGGRLAMTGVWSPVRNETGLGAFDIKVSELDALMPPSLVRIGRVESYYGPPTNVTLLRAVAFAVDKKRAILADLSP